MPTKDVYEESAVAMIARAKKETWIGESVKFEMVQDGKGDKVPDKEDTFATLACRYDIASLPKVHDDDPSYLLEYKVTVKGKTRLANNKYRVWPSLYEIEAELENGDPAKFCDFYVSGGNNRGSVTLNSDGKGQYEPTEPGAAPKFEPKSPYELVSWDKEVGRKRKAKLERKPYTAQFWTPHWPAIPSGLQFVSTVAASGRGYYQVVNLDGSSTDYYGTSMRFKVAADGDQGRSKSSRLGKQDDEIHVKVEFHNDNSERNDDPKPGVKQTAGGTLVEAHTNKTQTFTVKLAEDGEPGEFDVVFGHAGGDKVVVSIGVTSACQDASYEIITRRRVFYQVTRNAGQDDPDLDRAEKALEDVGVNLTRYKIRSLKPADKPGGGKISWIDGAYFADGEQKLNVGNYNKTYYHGLWSDKDPRGQVMSPRLHLLYTDVQYDAYDPMTTGSDSDYVEVSGQKMKKTDKIDWKSGPKVVGVRLNLTMRSLGLFDKRLYDGSDPFVGGTWKVIGEATEGAFSSADVWLASDHLSIKLPAACNVHLNANKEVGIKFLILARARGPYLGEAANRKILCVVTQSNTDINDTVTHEVGHVMSLVASACPPGLNLDDHTRKYVGNGHQGGHCAKGMSADNYNNGAGKVGSDYAGKFGGKPECTCVMYGEGSASCTGKFCDLCTPFAKAAKIT